MHKGHAAAFIVAAASLTAAFVLGFYFRDTVSHRQTSPSCIYTNGRLESPARVSGDTAGAIDSVDRTEALPAPLFEILPDRQRFIGLRTVAVKHNRMVRTIRTVGRIDFDERKLTTINMKYEGWVEKLYADYSGKRVSRGERLAEIYSPEAASVQLEYLNLMKWKTQVPRFQRTIEFEWGDRYGTNGRFVSYDPELLVEVARQKFRLWGFTDRDIEQLEKKGDAYRTITVRSPVSGYIFEKPAFRGSRVNPGDKLFDIVDLSTVWVLADVYEHELASIHEGQEAKIHLSNYPGKNYAAKVDFVYPALSGNTRTVKVRFIVPNPEGTLKPQMFADVEMPVDLGQRLSVPREAVFDTGSRQIVYVDAGNGFFQARRIREGMRTDSQVEVTEGLRAGERIVARPVFLVDSEAKLKGCSE